MPQAQAERLVVMRQQQGRFHSVGDFHVRTGLPVIVLRRLAEADAFSSLGLSRRQALWEVLKLKDEENPLLGEVKGQRDRGIEGQRDKGTEGQSAGSEEKGGEPASVPLSLRPSFPLSLRPSVPLSLPYDEPPVVLPTMPLGQEVMTDYATTGLSLKKHPVALVREELSKRRVITSQQLMEKPDGRWVKVAGLVLIRQRPGTASGIVFETLEDETGVVNLVVKPDIYERYRPAARHAQFVQADGYVQRSGQVVHVIAKRLHDLSDLLTGYDLRSRDFH
jgi:error-prone DNA polymerase